MLSLNQLTQIDIVKAITIYLRYFFHNFRTDNQIFSGSQKLAFYLFYYFKTALVFHICNSVLSIIRAFNRLETFHKISALHTDGIEGNMGG